MQNSIVPLPDVTKVIGKGLPCEARLVQRKGEICHYELCDGSHEVFKVKVAPEETIFTKTYPAREKYPSNEDFGSIAWCFTTKEAADRRFRELTSSELLYTPKSEPRKKLREDTKPI